MPVKKITTREFFDGFRELPVLDVRSPAEYNHAHIPGAYSLPLFSDEQRKIVGTAYKQQSRQAAIKAGLDFFGTKMTAMLQEGEDVIKDHLAKIKADAHQYAAIPDVFNSKNAIVLHCWRGGMRSAGVAWLLDLYGFEVYTIAGGYKAYRNFVLAQFELDYNLFLIGGYTGSGKTALINELRKQGHAAINLEGIANHKGSAFGDMGPQPTQEMFENELAEALLTQNKPGATIWIEDESQRIGQLNIPAAFWNSMRNKPICFVDIPFEKRLEQILLEYAGIEKTHLINNISRIQKRLGPLETKTAINFLHENNYRACFNILLTYYDKFYKKSLLKRSNASLLINEVGCEAVDTISNIKKVLACLLINA